MNKILYRSQRIFLTLLLCFGINLAAEATYSNVYFFGDSLSDTGNLYTASGGTIPPAPYDDGRFSNGSLWVEHLAGGLGLSGASAAFLSGGNNYAWVGAKSGTAGLSDPLLGIQTGLQAQVAGYWGTTHPAADPNALYVIGIGGNDLADIAESLPGAGDAATRLAQAGEVIANLLFSMDYLIERGARHFLIANAPNLGLTPQVRERGFAAAATDLAAQYNLLLAAAIADLSDRASIGELDLFGLLTTVVDDALAGGNIYGLDNGQTECIESGLDTCSHSVFFDDFHPTAAVHELAGQAALAALGINRVPEPAGLPLLLAALVAAGIARRRSLVAKLA